MSCQPSALITSIHRNLPYFTNNPFEGLNLTNATFTVDNIIQDVERAGAWSGIILAVVLFFMILTCSYCCCACIFCCRGGKKPAAVKVLLGIVTSAIIVLCIAIVFASFWAETSLHKGISDQIKSIGTFIGNFTDDTDTSLSIDTIVISVEDSRNLAFVVYLVILLILMIVTFVVVILAPLCKSGIGVIVVVVLIGIVTILVHGPLSVFMFGVLVIYSDVCVALFSILCDAFNLSNIEEFTIWVKTLDVFCNNTVQSGFILFGFGLAMTLLFILIQIFGIAYGLSFFGKEHGSFSPNEPTGPVSMRGTNIWGNSDEVAQESVYPSAFKGKVEEDKAVLVQMTDIGHEELK